MFGVTMFFVCAAAGNEVCAPFTFFFFFAYMVCIIYLFDIIVASFAECQNRPSSLNMNKVVKCFRFLGNKVKQCPNKCLRP